MARFEKRFTNLSGGDISQNELLVALHQSPGCSQIYQAEAKLMYGEWQVDILKRKGTGSCNSTWERLGGSPFNITVGVNTDEKHNHCKNTTSITSAAHIQSPKQSTSESVSKEAKTTLFGLLSEAPMLFTHSKSHSLQAKKGIEWNALAVIIKKSPIFEQVFCWALIIYGLLGCIYIAFLILKILFE